jgi:hypothetical protein
LDGIEEEIDRIDQGGTAWDDTDTVVDVKVSPPLDTVVPVRMTAETYATLRYEAHTLGVRPSTLIRMWVLEKLRDVSRPRRTA